jgi:Ca-activated chloride channel family protein
VSAARAKLGLLLAIAVTAAGGAPALAQQNGRPAVGGGSFVEAPLLKPGTYRDSLLPDEQLYYAIDLQAGQRLRVQATTGFSEDARIGLVQSINPLVFTPLRDSFCCVAAAGPSPAIEQGSEEIDITTETVLPLNRFATSDEQYAGPGTYYVAFNAFYNAFGPPPRIEIPITFTLTTQGTPTPGPPIEIEPDDTDGVPEGSPPSSSADASSEDHSEADVLAAGAFLVVVGVLGGAGLGYGLRRLRHRPG